VRRAAEICNAGASSLFEIRAFKERVGALYKRAWDEQWGRGIGLANRLLG
jgi:hypothetical protein